MTHVNTHYVLLTVSTQSCLIAMRDIKTLYITTLLLYSFERTIILCTKLLALLVVTVLFDIIHI